MANDVRRVRVSPGVALGVLSGGVRRNGAAPAGRGVARVLQGQGGALSQMETDACECAGAHQACGVRIQCNYEVGERRMLRWST
jgi:hypothetical protein